MNVKPNYLWFSISEDLSQKKNLNLLSEVDGALPFYIGCPYLFFHRPHQRDHHRVRWADGFLPPWTSPASCWPPLPATQWEPWEALTELPAVISTPAGGERNSTPGELSSCSVVHVFRCCQRVVLACLVSVRGISVYHVTAYRGYFKYLRNICESFPYSSCKCTSHQCQIKLQYYE